MHSIKIVWQWRWGVPHMSDCLMRARVAACGRISFTATSVCRHLARHTVPSAPLPISSSSCRSDLEYTRNKRTTVC